MTEKKSIVSRVVNGLKWNYLSVILSGLFQLVYTGVMARLIEPSAFGLIAMANIILRFGVYFSRMGIGSAIIQKKDLTDEDIRGGFTLSILLGGLVTLILFLAAPLSQFVFDSEEVIPVIRVYSISMLINGLSIVPVSLLRRKFRFRSLAIAETLSFFIGSIIVGIPLAYYGFGVWSLVISTLVQGAVLSILTNFIVKSSFHPLFSFRVFGPLINFGGRVSLISFFEFLNYNLDTIVIGRFLGASLLGIYNRALHVVSVPSEKISASLIKVLFSSFSELQSDISKVRRAHLISLEILGYVMFVFAFSISGSAKEIVLVILGDQWLDAIPILRILALSIPFLLLNSINGILFEAMGWLNIKIIMILARLILQAGLFVILISSGLIGISIGVLIIVILYYLGYLVLSIKRVREPIEKVVRVNASILGAGLLALGLTYLFSWVFSQLAVAHILILFLQIGIGGLLLLVFFYIRPSKSIVHFAHHYLIKSGPSSKVLIRRFFEKRYNHLYRQFYEKV